MTPVWRCDRCGIVLDPATNDGSIYFDYAEWDAFREASATWEAAHTTPDGWMVATARDLAEAPTLHWHVAHDACDRAPAERGDVYWIDVARLDSWAKVADWSAHLHGKNWFPDTDWGTLLYRAGVGKVAA